MSNDDCKDYGILKIHNSTKNCCIWRIKKYVRKKYIPCAIFVAVYSKSEILILKYLYVFPLFLYFHIFQRSANVRWHSLLFLPHRVLQMFNISATFLASFKPIRSWSSIIWVTHAVTLVSLHSDRVGRCGACGLVTGASVPLGCMSVGVSLEKHSINLFNYRPRIYPQ
jgi:hypothetical protein